MVLVASTSPEVACRQRKWRPKEKTGVPILLNTSFNDREPIVETPEHAIKCFMGTDIDYLYFREHKILVERK